jgi:hypothetical protein
MNHVFSIGNGSTVPDGTVVYPFLNPRDSESQIPWDLSGDVSLALGEIGAQSKSKIHIHPLVTLITWVVSGTLQIQMKAPEQNEPYLITLHEQQAALTKPQTYLQHINATDLLCRVLYIVNPAYVFLKDSDQTVVYDDAVVVEYDWEELARQQWVIPSIADIDGVKTNRSRALMRLDLRKRNR